MLIILTIIIIHYFSYFLFIFFVQFILSFFQLPHCPDRNRAPGPVEDRRWAATFLQQPTLSGCFGLRLGECCVNRSDFLGHRSRSSCQHFSSGILEKDRIKLWCESKGQSKRDPSGRGNDEFLQTFFFTSGLPAMLHMLCSLCAFHSQSICHYKIMVFSKERGWRQTEARKACMNHIHM